MSKVCGLFAIALCFKISLVRYYTYISTKCGTFAAAISVVTAKEQQGIMRSDKHIMYGLKNTIYSLLMSSADLLQGVALTNRN